MKSTQLRVSEISAASPDMDEAQFNELVEDIRRQGQLVPIWVCGDEVIDGRKRLRACQIIGIDPKIIDVTTAETNAVIARALNVFRTHYSKSQIAMFAAKMANLNVGRPKTQVNHDCGNSAPSAEFPKSVDRVAGQLGVGATVVNQAKRLRRKGSPEIIAAVEAGKISTKAAAAIIQLPKEEQAGAIQSRLELPQDKHGRRHSPPNIKFKTSPRRALDFRMDRTLGSLETAVELVGQFLDESGADNHGSHAKWMRRLYKARKGLGRIIKKHGGHDEQ